MFGFLNRKKDKKNNKQEINLKDQEPQYTCLFCKKTFRASEIEFANTCSTPDPKYADHLFRRTVGEYQQINVPDENGMMLGLSEAYRRFLDPTRWTVLDRDENGLPMMVRGPFKKDEREEKRTGDGLGFDDDGMDGDGISDDADIVVTSEERLCPRCHFSLPRGFSTDKVIQVGLLGGSRSGKTTYMAVATKYLQNKMTSMNSGLELADVELLPECRKYQEALYQSQKGADGATATPIVGEVVDKRVMPIVMRITPTEKKYNPFFLIFQDIPGEYLKPENRKYLLNSSIPESNQMILLVDINHFIHTDQQNKDEYGRKASEFGGYCEQDVNELFSNIPSLGRMIPEGQMHSVQCMLTKLDFWQKEEPGRLDGAVFTTNCDAEHKYAISDERLSLVHEQIKELLYDIGNKDQSGLLDNLVNSMGLQDKNVHKAYTAVASRIVPKHEDQIKEEGAKYELSLNVLEPLMNIFEWEQVLPVKTASNQ